MLHPVARAVDLPDAVDEAGARLVVADALGCRRLFGAAEGRAAAAEAVQRCAPLLVLLDGGARELRAWASLRSRHDSFDRLELPRVADPARMALELAARLGHEEALPFLAALPPALPLDHRLAVLWAVERAELRLSAGKLASRCELEPARFERDLRRAGIASGEELCEGMRLWRAVAAVDAGIAVSVAQRVYGFGGPGAFGEACLRLTGLGPEALVRQQSVAVLERLAERWAGGGSASGRPYRHPRWSSDPTLRRPRGGARPKPALGVSPHRGDRRGEGARCASRRGGGRGAAGRPQAARSGPGGQTGPALRLLPQRRSEPGLQRSQEA